MLALMRRIREMGSEERILGILAEQLGRCAHDFGRGQGPHPLVGHIFGLCLVIGFW